MNGWMMFIIWGTALCSFGLGWFMAASFANSKRDDDDDRLWDPEDCRHPPLRFPEGVPFQ